LSTLSQWLLPASFVLAAAANIWLWVEDRSRLPRYVHALALLAFLLGVSICVVEAGRARAVGRECVLLVALMPMIVYVVFGTLSRLVLFAESHAPDDSDGAA
jgi:hypothetical protein